MCDADEHGTLGPAKGLASGRAERELHVMNGHRARRIGAALVGYHLRALATGDQQFREKSRKRIEELISAAKGIVLVTHDMNWVTTFCNRAMLLEKGHVVAEGAPAEVVEIHQEHSERARREKEAEAERLRLKGVL